MKKIVELDSIQKKFKEKVIFDSFSCTIYENEFVAIIGKSGCGKSTLLNMIGLLDSPDSGEIILFGEKGIKPFSKKATLLLKSKIGYLFQNFALIENKTVYENLQMAINENLLIYNRVVVKMKVVYPFYESVIIKKPKKVNV